MDWNKWLVMTMVALSNCQLVVEEHHEHDSGTTSMEDALCNVPIVAGITGTTQVRTCDVEGDCVDPESGVVVRLYDRQPDGGEEVAPIDHAISDEDGHFEFELEIGTYFLCVVESTDEMLCSDAIMVGVADALIYAEYEHGNGSTWTVRTCTG